MTRGSVSTDSCEKAVYPEYYMGLERTACGVLKKERTTSRLAVELTQRPCLKLFIFKGHDCLMFQAAFHSKGRIKYNILTLVW